MSNASKNEYFKMIKPRYQLATKSEKESSLNEFCSVCGYNRKYAIRKLNKKFKPKIAMNIRNVARKENMIIP